MKFNLFIFILLLCAGFNLLYSYDFEYKVYHNLWHDKTSSKFDVNNEITYRSGISNNHVICVGDTENPNGFINKVVTYNSMNIISFCGSLEGVEPKDWTRMCGEGYTTATSPNFGKVRLVSNSQKSTLISQWPGLDKDGNYGSFISPNSVTQEYTTTNGWAKLSKFVGSPLVDVNARGGVGVGCTGTYKYDLERYMWVLIPGSPGSWQWVKIDEGSYTGELSGLGKDYEFKEEGKYRIKYTTVVKECFTVYEESYGTTKLVHLFKDRLKTPTTQTATKTLNLEVVSKDGPDYGVYGEGATCAFTTTPNVELVKGTQVMVPVSMIIENDYTVPVKITGVSANYYKGSSITPTGDITVGTISFSTVTIPAKEERTITFNVPSTLLDVKNTAESYGLKLRFNYKYDGHPQGCFLAGSGTGGCNNALSVNIAEDPITYNLKINVNVDPDKIDRKFIEDGKDTIDVTGRVAIEIDEPDKDPYEIWANGANVRLVNVRLFIPGKAPITCYTGSDTGTTNINGEFFFNNVKLDENCLKYEKIGNLVARVSATHTHEGESLSTTGFGHTPVDTSLPQLGCTIKYKMTGSSYGVEKSTEEYEMLVEIENLLGEGTITYNCGEEGETGSSDELSKEESEYIFDCEYEFDIGISEEDAIYLVQARIKDLFSKDLNRETTCSTEVGLCLPYV